MFNASTAHPLVVRRVANLPCAGRAPRESPGCWHPGPRCCRRPCGRTTDRVGLRGGAGSRLVTVPGSVVRAELRRRVWSLIVLAALLALVVTAVAGALAGAHRTATSVDRFRAWAH